MEPSVIAENDFLLVLDKPAGLITHSDGRTVEPSLAAWLERARPELAGVGGAWVSPQGESIRLQGLVHRLDRTTSGVLVAAKTDEVFAFLKNEFKNRRVDKAYRAFLHGHRERDEGVIVAEIMRSNDKVKRWYARPCQLDDKRAAVTEWTMLDRITDSETASPVSYIEARPKTGRTHQLRVHFSATGNPIVGDTLYGPEKPTVLGFTRPALHAYRISFFLPDGEAVSYVAPLPPDFEHVLSVK